MKEMKGNTTSRGGRIKRPLAKYGPTERARRLLRQYTAHSIAEASGVHVSTVQRFLAEGSTTQPPMEMIHKMLESIGERVTVGRPRIF